MGFTFLFSVGRGTSAPGDADGLSPVPLGTMPSTAALAGLPCVDGSLAPGGPHTGATVLGTTAPGSKVVRGSMPGTSALGMASGGRSMPGTSDLGITSVEGSMPGTSALGIASVGGSSPGTWQSRVPTAGAYVGDGMPPVPAKLVNKIRRWEFIEMGELLPEFWVGPKKAEGDVGKEKRGRQSRKVTDVFTWLQCFRTYVAVLATHEPTVVPELMAYMGLIIRVSQDYEGLGWVRYDSAFRRQAALSGNKKWSAVNGTLFTMNFSGRASGTRRCELCFATSHSERECVESGNPEPDVGERLRSLESVLIAMARPSPPVRPQRLSGQVCRKWNTVGCTFPSCRHAHVCSSCGGNHPAVHCGGSGPTPRFMAPAAAPFLLGDFSLQGKTIELNIVS